jgi:aspartate racemase
MKTIGLIGGMSWESSLEYYRIINEEVKARLGGLHSADCLMYSFDFAEIEALQEQGAWDVATERMITAARQLEAGGADCVVICTNTMHKMFGAVQDAVNLPLIHIADATAAGIREQGLQRLALLGTRYTMEQDFYKGRLIEAHGFDVLIPDSAERDVIHRVIYDELTRGVIQPQSRAAYVEIIARMAKEGAEGAILGCTEIGLLIKQSDSPIPVFDTTYLHAIAAVDFALS